MVCGVIATIKSWQLPGLLLKDQEQKGSNTEASLDDE